METITRAELIALDGAPDATHATFRKDGTLYFCVNIQGMQEDDEAEYWKSQGFTMKKVTLGE